MVPLSVESLDVLNSHFIEDFTQSLQVAVCIFFFYSKSPHLTFSIAMNTTVALPLSTRIFQVRCCRHGDWVLPASMISFLVSTFTVRLFEIFCNFKDVHS